MERFVPRHAFRASTLVSTAIPAPCQRFACMPLIATRKIGSVPTIAQGSFWRSLIPKPLRRRRQDPNVNFGPPKTFKKPKKEWNPATFYIFIFLFIGSMSIQMISLKKDHETFKRRADTRIGILREVVDKLQKGEEVDVEKALGTGVAEEEKEWEEVLREIERDDSIRTPKKPDRPRHSSSTTRAESRSDWQPAQAPNPEQGKTKASAYSGFF